LASQAGIGEILVSDAAYNESGLDLEIVEHKQIAVKGKEDQIAVRVLGI
jgi:hypothetical protein